MGAWSTFTKTSWLDDSNVRLQTQRALKPARKQTRKNIFMRTWSHWIDWTFTFDLLCCRQPLTMCMPFTIEQYIWSSGESNLNTTLSSVFLMCQAPSTKHPVRKIGTKHSVGEAHCG